MNTYTITEPHPSVPQNTWTHSGRGGAGNTFRAPKTTDPSGVPTRTTSNTSYSGNPGRFYSGRGGAGNAHAAVERPVLSFDDEYRQAEVREKAATLGHVGRGGAGNVFASMEKSKTQHRKSMSSSRRDSNSTQGSVHSGFWRRISNAGLGN